MAKLEEKEEEKIAPTPEGGVVLLILSHMEKLLESNDRDEADPPDFQIQAFKIPAKKLSADELEYLEGFCTLSHEIGASQVWIDLSRRLGVWNPEDEIDEDEEKKFVETVGGSLKEYELREVTGSLVKKGDNVTHVFCVEC